MIRSARVALTRIPRLARNRVRDYVNETENRCFTADDVAVDVLALKRLEHAGLLESSGERHSESRKIYFFLPEGAVEDQEMHFVPQLAKIRAWCSANRKYVFRGRDVGIRENILNVMVSGGLLEKTGKRYTIFWRSLAGRWGGEVKNV